MRCTRTALLLAPALLVACVGNPDRHTLAELRHVEPDMREVPVSNSLDQAMAGYRKFLEDAPQSALTPEAMRRLADLALEKEYGILGGADHAGLPAPESASRPAPGESHASDRARDAHVADHSESDEDFERRATRGDATKRPDASFDVQLPGQEKSTPSGPLEAIKLYDQILKQYPNYPYNDQVLYQKARAYDELGDPDKAIAVMEQLIVQYPNSRHLDEVHFRRGEYFFTRRRYLDAEDAYSAVTRMGPASEYYELALYKLGWTLYKQELYDDAIDKYIALLDYKVSTGYDFDKPQDENDAQRVADTYRVISLSFSSLGGADSVKQYFEAKGNRIYEDRVYSQLGEFYLEKLRYQDAAAAYETFIALHPLHRSSPRFNMRVIEIYEKGGFPKLVLESKKKFAATYGLQSEYWRHFDVDASPEVLSYLKSNLKDLANHYHALYQEPEHADEKAANFSEALRWYRAFLTSFPKDEESPAINYRLADLLLEHKDFGDAAREYERTAYDYPAHEKAGAAGYAAIYAYREQEKQATGAEHDQVRREAVTSTLRFVDAFPDNEHSAAVLAVAVDDLYDMKEFDQAIATARKLLDHYPKSEPSIRRSAWAAIANASFDTADYPTAEDAYGHVLELTPEKDDSRQAVVDDLAAAIYKQGEQANLAKDYRTAANHFLRIAKVAPTSKIRPIAEYDASAALIHLEDWDAAAAVLEAFQKAYPEHKLHREATRQMAFVYQHQGNLSRAAGEYERVAKEAEDPEHRSQALLAAGELYEKSQLTDRALAVYLRYVKEFPTPVELAVETRFKIAGMYKDRNDEANYHDQLKQIIGIDRTAGEERTPRIHYLAAQSALVLTEPLYDRFDEVKLVQPFEKNLQEKQRRMDEALQAFGSLLDYEVGDVTAAATYYMAEIYLSFSKALMESERPAGLSSSDLQAYDAALEEESFPFEQRAIDVHEKNLELMAEGVYDSWIEKSLSRLAELVPGRYAKFEASSGFIDSIDTYAYRAPSGPGPAAPPPEAPAATQPADSPAQANPDDRAQAPPQETAPAPDASAPAAPSPEPLEAAPAGGEPDATSSAGPAQANPDDQAQAPPQETAPAPDASAPAAPSPEPLEAAPAGGEPDATSSAGPAQAGGDEPSATGERSGDASDQ